MNRNLLPLAAVAATLALGACAPAQMRVAPSLTSVPAVPVSGANPRKWNSQVAFGPWHTSVAREGMKWDFGLPLLGLTAGYSTQPYRVVLSSGSQTLQAECVTRSLSLARRGLSVDPAFGRLPALACGFRGLGDGTLRLHGTALNAEKGRIDFGDTVWGLRSVNRFDGSPLPSEFALGYEIDNGDRVVAAVETLNRGRVWMDPALSPRDQERLAGAIMVLLLYQPADGE